MKINGRTIDFENYYIFDRNVSSRAKNIEIGNSFRRHRALTCCAWKKQMRPALPVNDIKKNSSHQSRDQEVVFRMESKKLIHRLLASLFGQQF
jgi:hypothetical protein